MGAADAEARGRSPWLLGALAIVSAPLLASLLGVWNAPGAWLLSVVLSVVAALGEAVEGTELLPRPELALPVLVLTAGAAGAVPSLRRPLLHLATVAGACGALGLLLVAVPIDRPVFVAGALLLWRHRGGGRLSDRLAAGLWTFLGFGIALIAALTILEGPGVPSPPFRLRSLWMGVVARQDPHALGFWALWFGAGLAAAVRATPQGSLGRQAGLRRPISGVAVDAVLVVAGSAASTALAPDRLQLPAAVSAAAVLISVPALAGLGPAGGAWRSGPRLTAPLLFAGLAAMRALVVWMWTPLGSAPPGVEWLSWRPGTFGVTGGSAGDEGLWWSDREHTLVAHRTEDGRERRWDLRGRLDAVEEIAGPYDGRIWVAGGRFRPEAHMGLLDLRPDGSLGAFQALDRCYPSAWVPLPAAAAGAAGVPPESAALGCEGATDLRIFDPIAGTFVGSLQLADDVESAAFDPDGTRFWTTSLWSGSSVIAYRWPDGVETGRRHVGPFNWAVVFDGRRTLWVTRFFEGGILPLDAETLEPGPFLPLSYGVRALVHDPRFDRLWAAAAYSGRIWMVEASQPHRRRSWSLCGQARNLYIDPLGRAVVGTDCGLFRIDAGVEPW